MPTVTPAYDSQSVKWVFLLFSVVSSPNENVERAFETDIPCHLQPANITPEARHMEAIHSFPCLPSITDELPIDLAHLDGQRDSRENHNG